MIYADNAATTKTSPAAVQAMVECMENCYGNPSSPNEIGAAAKQRMEDARQRIAGILGCHPKELIFTSGGTESVNQAILSAASHGQNCGKKHILSTAIEHHAVLSILKLLEKRGFSVTLLDVPESGIVRLDRLQDAIQPDTCLVSVMAANNELGTIQPISEIGNLCREKNILFHTDAVQAAGHIPIDLQNIDLLSLSAHKFHGPKGIGALYIRRGMTAESLIRGGMQERGRRAGTENLPAIVGMAAAMEEFFPAIDENAARLIPLRDRLIRKLDAIPYSGLNGHPQNRLPGIVNFCFEGIEAQALLLLLDQKGICASSGSACTSGSLDPSHVLTAIGRPPELAHSALRLSLGEDITEAEVDFLADAVAESVRYLRGSSQAWKLLTSGKKPHLLPE